MQRRGFTLIELMLVVIIIGVLSVMVVPKFVGRGEQAKVTAARADIEANLSIALDLYELDNGAYPSDLGALMNEPSPSPPNWNGPYLKKKPKDPWLEEYQYTYPGEHNKNAYDLWSNGRDRAPGGGDDITNWEETD